MQFSTVFQLYCGSQCAYPCFPGVLLTSTLHNILSKPLAAFPQNPCRNNEQYCEIGQIRKLDVWYIGLFHKPCHSHVCIIPWGWSPQAQSVAYKTWEQKVAGSIQSLANILSEDWWYSLQQDSFLSHYCPLFLQWFCGKAAKGLERILCVWSW